MLEVEVARQLHEDIERHLEEVIQEVQHQPKGHRHKIHHEHFVGDRLDDIRRKRQRLLDHYVEAAKHPKEVQALTTVEVNFYSNLKQTEAYHSKFPGLPVEQPVMLRPDPDECKVEFSGEEGYGRYLDMHDLYLRFMELPFNYDAGATKGRSSYGALVTLKVKPIDYLNWLQRCTNFANLPRNHKNQQYKSYLEAMLAYLKSFYQRTQPLAMDAEQVLQEAREQFEVRWVAGDVLGWEDVRLPPPADAAGGEEGTKKRLTKGERRALFQKSVAELEEVVQKFYDTLSDNVAQTVKFIERKETKSKEELEAETDRDAAEARKVFEENYKIAAEKQGKSKDDDTVDARLRNLKKLPIGFDGQPIPFWLYRLHGLNMKFTCEICRGFTYIGPKAFDQHFQEARHAYGMQCLHIPNTKHFHHVTKIKDAIALWNKIKTDAAQKQWVAENEQEHEDSEGHVFNKKTMDDMMRQGLIEKKY